MANAPEFIARKHGKAPITYLHMSLAPDANHRLPVDPSHNHLRGKIPSSSIGTPTA